MIIGTRGSALAIMQTRWVIARLRQFLPSEVIEEKVIQTEADRNSQLPLAGIGQKGAFVNGLETALTSGEIDAAVHSLKDLPCVLDKSFCLAAIPEREDPHDCLVSRDFRSLADLPGGAVVGTGSPRRKAFLLHWRPDLTVRDLRGNIDSRLGKIQSCELDAIILALAGLRRLGLQHQSSEVFTSDRLMPAPGQGALGLECRTEDTQTQAKLKYIESTSARACAEAERALAARLGATCHTALGALATNTGQQIVLKAMLAHKDGLGLLCDQMTGCIDDFADIGLRLADKLLARGGSQYLPQNNMRIL